MYNIYIKNGIINLKSGNILSRGTESVYIDSGAVTLGEPEPTDSLGYGKDTANVSTTNPYIEAIGTTTGIGIKNVAGRLNYYDGKIVGSTAAKPEVASDIEYLYESIDYTDEETGYKYCILEWMR